MARLGTPADTLLFVQGLVGLLQQLLHRLALRSIQSRYSRTHRERPSGRALRIVGLEVLPQTFEQQLRAFVRRLQWEDSELVAAQPGHDIGAAVGGPQDVS